MIKSNNVLSTNGSLCIYKNLCLEVKFITLCVTIVLVRLLQVLFSWVERVQAISNMIKKNDMNGSLCLIIISE